MPRRTAIVSSLLVWCLARVRRLAFSSERTMKALAVLFALEAVASAQPSPVDPPVVATGHEMAVRMTTAARNAAARGKCALIDPLARRVYELDAVYYDQVFAIDATIGRCRPGLSAPGMVAGAPGMVVIAEPSPPRSAATVELGIGGGVWTDGGHDALYGLGGPTFGIGSFVNPTLAVSVRMSGSLYLGEGGMAYIGVLGPNLQAWLNDRAWVGGGGGLGFAIGCGEGCDGIAGLGLDARLGYAFQPRGQRGMNLSIEVSYASFGELLGGIETVSALLGYQTF
jgi:hypothetical protein